MCGPTSDKFSEKLFYAPKRVSDVRWNFEVFLIDRKGKPLYRYSPDAPISDIECDIKELVRPGRTDGQKELIVQPIVERLVPCLWIYAIKPTFRFIVPATNLRTHSTRPYAGTGASSYIDVDGALRSHV